MVAPFLVNFPFLSNLLVSLSSIAEASVLFLQLVGIISVLVKLDCT